MQNEATNKDLEIRQWHPGDSVSEITALLHRAYADLAIRGLKYHATWQDDETTRKRLQKGVPFVATINETLVGTLRFTCRQREWISLVLSRRRTLLWPIWCRAFASKARNWLTIAGDG